jgi:excinuclease UvrABC nuclease subunit
VIDENVVLEFAEPWVEDDWTDEVWDAAKRSGVYVIRLAQTEEVFYVGESHTGRLRTLVRHFYNWDDDTQVRHTYDRHRVEVAIVISAPKEALELEALLIEELEPRDNEHGQVFDDDAPVLDDDGNEVPF